MGRYTTVQAYADNNPNMRAVDYAQATGTAAAGSGSSSSHASVSGSGSTTANRGPLVTEKVDNPYGSTAGAGSGEFHVYRHARAREMARWERIGQEEMEARAEEEYTEVMRRNAEDEARATEKRRRKRERERESKRRKKNMRLGGVGVGVGGGGGEDVNGEEGRRGDDEFEYTSIAVAEMTSPGTTTSDADAHNDEYDRKPSGRGKDDDDAPPTDDAVVVAAAVLPFPNDGSFLERMRRELAGGGGAGGGVAP